MKLTILGAPRTKKTSQRIVRNKATGRMFVMSSTSSKGWEKSAILQLQAQWKQPAFAEPVNLRAVFYRERATGDLSNFLSALCDALERGGVVANDRLICGFDGCRLDKDAANPRVELEVEALRAVGR